jgi:hypothetical protein
MPISRPFAFNVERINVSGTYNIGNLCVVDSSITMSDSPGNLTFWNGPDEELGYCIGKSVPSQNQPTPVGNVGNVGFWRTNGFTDDAFLKLVNTITGQNFTNTPTACAYLDSNGYWTSYNDLITYYFVVSNRCSPINYRVEGTRTRNFIIADSSPAYILYQKPNRNYGRKNWNELTRDNVGSPEKISNGGATSSPHQYGYQRGYWLTDVVVYKKNGVIAFGFPDNKTFTYGTSIYQEIVGPWIP